VDIYYEIPFGLCVMVMVFNASFNNILTTLWRFVLLIEKTGITCENHDLVQVIDTL